METFNSSMYSAYNLKGEEVLSEEFNTLASYYSDYHKDVYGFRPRSVALCACDYNNRAELLLAKKMVEHEISRIRDYMDEVKSTFEGRERLRADGWLIDETDPELAKKAHALFMERVKERDRHDY
jgi:hypothetical protein